MRILSQSRTYSVDFDNAELFTQGNHIHAVVGGKNTLLGTYVSDERARDVFMDIHNAYAPVYSVSSGLSESAVNGMFVGSGNVVARNVVGLPDDSEITTYANYVYLMPEK